MAKSQEGDFGEWNEQKGEKIENWSPYFSVKEKIGPKTWVRGDKEIGDLEIGWGPERYLRI